MSSTPLVSIVTPSFNQACFLEKTIRSVLNQGYPNLEYIIVDGGSTDGSLDIIHRYTDHISWWVSEKDNGQADGINKGLSHASGDLVAWLNSDDMYYPGAIRSMVQDFNENPGAAFIYTDVLSVDADDRVFNIMRFAPYKLEDLMSFNILSQPGVFMRRSALEKAGYLDMSFYCMFDTHLWLKMAMADPFIYVPRVTAAARYHPMAKNLKAGAIFGQEAYRIAGWLKTHPDLKNRYRKISPRIWAGAHRINARYLLDGGQPALAFRAYIKSLANNPGIALKEWRRILYSLFSFIRIEKIKTSYLSTREKKHALEYKAFETNLADLIANGIL